jgi:hypothetical protein
MSQQWIADEKVVFLHPDGRRVPGRIAVGMPVQISDGEAGCAISLDGFDYIPGPLKGASPLQALLMALQFIGWRLHDFISSGGRVLHPDEDFCLDAYFGPLLCPAPTTNPPPVDGGTMG